MAVDKFDFIVYETNPDLYNRIRDAIIGYAVQNNIETEIYWLSKQEQSGQLAQLSKRVHVALVNGDCGEASLNVGKTIFDEDEDVLIVFYGSNAADLKPYFSSRPIQYLDFDGDGIRIKHTLHGLHKLLCERKKVFTWTNKNVRVFIPEKRIVYLQSYKGYVDIITTGGEKYHILGKLDAVQEKLQSSSFLRIHKSTIINCRQIRSMDRTNKCIDMANNDKVYISKAYYKSVSAFLESGLK